MRLLIANDDGVLAPGIAALHAALAARADYECQVVAPLYDMSGVSSALTLDRPLHPQRLPNGFQGVNGTPTDCVHLGLNGLLEQTPDMVVAGINLGANLGDDVLYSGTVAAAMEGRFLNRPAIAFSLVSRSAERMAVAAEIAARIVALHERFDLPPRTVLNVNIPDLPLEQIKGVQLTRLGHRAQAKPPVREVNPRGKVGYWISVSGDAVDGGPGTDFHAVLEGYVSVTPLQFDRTFREGFAGLSALTELLA